VILSGAPIEPFEGFVGGRVNYVGAYLAGRTWETFDRSSIGDRGGRVAVVGVPMVMKSGGSLAAGASGAYDGHFRGLAQRLVREGQPDAVLRLGWEFNGDWFPWKASVNPTAFASYFRRIVSVMRSVEGERFRFAWNPGLGPRNVDLRTWPGDGFVDVVAIDFYDRNYSERTRDPAVRWQRFMEGPYGLGWFRDFARQHGKPMAIAEWGLSERSRFGENRDNPYFIQRVAEYVRSHPTMFHLYFNVRNHEGDFRIQSFPRAAAVYRQEF
jgi:hypothetical protein